MCRWASTSNRRTSGDTLSSDGRLLARQIGAVQVEIRPRGNSTHGKVVTARGGFHNGVLLHMGESFLVLEIDAGCRTTFTGRAASCSGAW